ncbi:hypothetical protein N0V82_010719 [Gnomoniopsis sp. IMI 355080]|nr:hypothetical protein N0V82_010719 [Gnomoniopsis sp. IMI 355080]
MADGSVRMVAAYPSPPNHSSPQYPYHSQPSEPRRKEVLSALPLRYDNTRANMAASSVSPLDIKAGFGGVGTAIAYGGKQSSTLSEGLNEKNSLLSGLGFTKSSAEKKLTRDGQPAKRRGPKPDSKPAMTRRQELNRQAQRTHRERKELYIKALEDEVLRLKEVFSNVSQDKERLAKENYSLKALLQQNGLSMSAASGMLDDNMSNASVGPYMGSSPVSGSHSYGLPSATTQQTPYTPPSGPALSATGAMPQGLSPPGLSPGNQAAAFRRPSPGAATISGPQRNPNLDYEQSGIDFVLHLEQPCMDHMPWLLERSSANGGLEPCGHALMASCPPEPFTELTPGIPFGDKRMTNIAAHGNHAVQQKTNSNPNTSLTANRNFSRHTAASLAVGDLQANGAPSLAIMGTERTQPQLRTWELSKADLNTLLDLSQKLNLDGEITPIMAWGMVLGHPRLGELNEADFRELSELLRSKVRCYGFGAVMEEFEVRDALEAIFSTKPEMVTSNWNGL